MNRSSLALLINCTGIVANTETWVGLDTDATAGRNGALTDKASSYSVGIRGNHGLGYAL
jgi:hypothetical protein